MMIFLKLLRESYLFAFQAIKINKVRTALSLSGITIGIFSVISVFTIFDSMELAIRDSINSLGNNVLFVQKWPWAMGGDYPWWKYWSRPEPDINDLNEIQRRSTASEACAMMFQVSRTVKYLSNSIEKVSIVAISHEYEKVMPLPMQAGRYFTQIESAGGRSVAIIGSTIAEKLFPGLDPIGRKIKVFGSKLEVIGITRKEGQDMFDESSDEQIMVPMDFARNYVDFQSVGATIVVRAKSYVSNDELRDEITGIMRSVRKLKPREEDNFAINETSIITQGFDKLFGVIAIVGWIIGGFSLLVGGFGIANIMFVSVKERTSQIGIQMSLGAKRFFILFQFLFEAIFLSLIGGAGGLLIILLGTWVMSALSSFDVALTQGNIFLGLFVSSLIGLISGLFPALQASRLNPVEAMRSTF
ncbi:MAG: ABC transporter permease [Bacteroidales bacterium]|nr:ABC transporter permease [Bacteroidales bacterium]